MSTYIWKGKDGHLYGYQDTADAGWLLEKDTNKKVGDIVYPFGIFEEGEEVMRRQDVPDGREKITEGYKEIYYDAEKKKVIKVPIVDVRKHSRRGTNGVKAHKRRIKRRSKQAIFK